MNKNQVASIPVSLSRCPRLKVLRLEENCLALEAITPQLLKESQISLLAVDGNLFDAKQMREADGYDQVFHNVLFQKISIPLPWKVFFKIEPPTPPEIPLQCHTFFPKIGLLKLPFPLEFPLIFHGVGMDIFWNYTSVEKDNINQLYWPACM